MGLHTWFYSNGDLHKKQAALYKKLDDHEDDIKYLEEYELRQIEYEVDAIDDKIRVGYHDCFRTSKREENGEYCLDVIYSREECDKWINDNIETIYELNKDYLLRFWVEFPDGAIDFG